MSIIIKGMEMPRDCSRCSIKVDPETRQCCVDKHLFEETLSVLISRRDKDCPLVELPPHGDLIDRDAILNAEKTKPIAKMMMFGGAYVIDLDVVRDAPVVVPAERRDADA